MTDSKTIFLIGKTGSGKSTLANVISGTDKFKESGASISVTKEIQSEEFTESNINYVIIDTVGIGDTKLTRNEVLDKIAEAVYLAGNGISQVLFVVDGRFDPIEVSIYNLLKTIIFDTNITDYTTIIRTKFDDFRTRSKCEEDIYFMLSKGGELAKIVESCQKRIIHVNNPSLSIKDNNLVYKEKSRIKSRQKILGHLGRNCQEGYYKPPQLEKLSEAIIDYMKEKLQKQKELKTKRKDLGLEEIDERNIDEENKVISNQRVTVVADSKNNSSRKEDNRIRAITEKVKQQTETGQDFENDEIDSRRVIEHDIASLEKEIKELKDMKQLKKEIQKIEESIREKVRRHILNNCDDISNMLGGENFINIIAGSNADLPEQNFNKLRKKCEELEKECQKRGGGNHSLDKIESRIKQKEQKLFELREELLNVERAMSEKYQEEWKKLGFSEEESRPWIKIGLKFNEAELASYLKQKNIQPNNLPKTIEELRNEYNQNWLNTNYPNRHQTKEIKIDGSFFGNSEKLHGFLTISDYPQLEKVEIWNQKNLTNLQINNLSSLRVLSVPFNNLTNLDINHLKDLEELSVHDNNLTELKLSNLVNLKGLWCQGNNLTNLGLSENNKLEKLNLRTNSLNQDLSFLKDLVNLRELNLSNNKFYGSLKFLKDLSKLKKLVIDDTDIDSGLEYLPDSLEEFYCSADQKPDARVKVIYEFLQNIEGESFSQKLQIYKQKIQEQIEIPQILHNPPKNI